MGLFRRIAGFLGFAKDDGGHEVKGGGGDAEEEDDDHRHNYPQQARSCNFQESGLPRTGFGVPVKVVVDRPHLAPVIVPCASGDGGVQGLRWHANRLRIDEDGDVADEFLNEVLPDTSSTIDDQHRPLPRFEMRYGTQPARIKNQVMSRDGKIQQCIDYQGRLQWV